MRELGSLPRLLTEAEAAAYLGICKQVLARWRREGKIGAIKLGRAWHYTPEQIVAFLNANESPRRR